jgi:hypothetical protein
LDKSDNLYKITAASTRQPSECLDKLRKTYDKTKREDDLKKLNRSALEEFYPQETPKSTATTHVARGHVSTYAVTPVELAQQVSTAARAANAVQIAASLAASLPAQGIGANAAFGYMNDVTGKVDALERVPLVIGYSESNDEDASNGHVGFGWLLGPKVVLDANNKALALEHNLVPYDLTADVSMPGWWPYFDITYNSSWAPDWRTKSLPDIPICSKDSLTLRVQKPLSRGDLDGITTLLLTYLISPKVDIVSIGRIDPEIVSACANSVTFLIQGSNLWRTQAAYLLGSPAQAIQVLPDMAGIAATFDMSSLPQRPFSYAPAQIVLSTPSGLTSSYITIDGSRLADPKCGGEGISPKQRKPGVDEEQEQTVFLHDNCKDTATTTISGFGNLSPSQFTAKLIMKGSSDFREEEFGEKYTIKQLCNALKKSKIPDKSEKCETLKDLNQLLRDADLYSKITKASDLKPSEYSTYLTELKETYDKTGPSDFREEEFRNKSIIQLCGALKDSGIQYEKCDTVEDLNELLRDEYLYKKITAVSDRQPSEKLTELQKTKEGDDLEKLNRYALEEFYPQQTPKKDLNQLLADRTEKENDLKKLNKIALEEFYPQQTPKGTMKNDVTLAATAISQSTPGGLSLCNSRHCVRLWLSTQRSKSHAPIKVQTE